MHLQNKNTMNNFNCREDYVLENDTVLLRPLQQNDFENLLSFALNEPDTWHYSLVTAAGADGLENYMNIALAARNAGTEYPFIVFDKRTNEYAGSTRFYDINIAFETLQLGYTWYGEKFRGTGLNKHCKYLLLEFCFEKINMQRVEFRADSENERSIAAMKSIGCKVDGVLRANMPKRQGGRRDSIVLSILRDEWFNEVKQKLKQKLL